MKPPVSAALLALACLALPATPAAGQDARPPVQLTVELAHPRVPSDKKMTTYLKVGLTGAILEASARRAPVNVALVIDKSGSMSGDKIIHAREAAKAALDRLGAEDVVSVIAYDSSVQLVAPATGLTDRESVTAAIDRIQAGGNTALFAGVSKGSEELRKFRRPDQVTRIVLLSDGMANVGPDSPQELGRLGAALSKEGISVTTLGLGLGYNEDLMTELALRSDGNHAFIQDSAALAEVFQNEFGDILSVMAQHLSIRIRCAEGVRPVRVLGREADVQGQEVVLDMNQIYAGQHKYVLLEVELPAGAADTDVAVAEVSVTFNDLLSKGTGRLDSRSVARRTGDDKLISASTNKAVLVEVAKTIATEKEALAVKLNDEGRHAEAMKAYTEAGSWAITEGRRLESPELEKLGMDQQNRQRLFEAGGASANAARKMSKDQDFRSTTQNTMTRSPAKK